MFRTLLRCPHCQNEIALEDSRTEVPLPEQSTPYKKVQLVYTVCPRCGRDFRVAGERRAAAIVLGSVFLLLLISFAGTSWWPLLAVGTILLFQKKLVQVLVRAEHA